MSWSVPPSTLSAMTHALRICCVETDTRCSDSMRMPCTCHDMLLKCFKWVIQSHDFKEIDWNLKWIHNSRHTWTWKSTGKKTESDTNTNTDSDRYPVISTIQNKLTGTKQRCEGRSRYSKCTNEQYTAVNRALEDIKTAEEQSNEKQHQATKQMLTRGT